MEAAFDGVVVVAFLERRCNSRRDDSRPHCHDSVKLPLPSKPLIPSRAIPSLPFSHRGCLRTSNLTKLTDFPIDGDMLADRRFLTGYKDWQAYISGLVQSLGRTLDLFRH